jgi:putative transposase
VANSNNTPGNANLPIGARTPSAGPKGGPNVNSKGANREIGAPRALQQNGTPRWHSRGYLPHFESSDVTQHVTFHLADSLPQTVLLQLESELKSLPIDKRDVERRKRVDAWIDAGHGSCVLRNPAIAEMVQGSLLTFDSQRYRLLAWVVMPNHVHVLFQPIQEWTVAKIVATWKKFTARKIHDAANQEIGAPRKDDPRNSGAKTSAPVWHREYWDRYIRDKAHFAKVVEYIHLNPVKAGLVAKAEDWRWSSAYPEDVPGNANLPIGVYEAKP